MGLETLNLWLCNPGCGKDVLLGCRDVKATRHGKVSIYFQRLAIPCSRVNSVLSTAREPEYARVTCFCFSLRAAAVRSFQEDTGT